MHALVPTHAGAVAECARANGTDVGFLPGVSAPVAHQPGQLVEDARAVFAAIAPLQRVHVAVTRQRVTTAILATALRALERFLLDVPQLVVAEHALVSEPLVADAASERAFPGVQSSVDDERFVQLEPFVAHGAFERFEARVRQLVAAEFGARLARPRTHGARQGRRVSRLLVGVQLALLGERQATLRTQIPILPL